MNENWESSQNIFLCEDSKLSDKEHWVAAEKDPRPLSALPPKTSLGETFEVKIEVGPLLTNLLARKHSIEWIDFYAGEIFLGRASFGHGESHSAAIFKIKLDPAPSFFKSWKKCNFIVQARVQREQAI